MRGGEYGLPLAVAAAWLAAVVLFEMLRPPGCSASLCLFRNVTGLPCPTCGSTRAVQALVAGRPLEALRHNPLVVTAPVAGAAWLLLRAAGAAPRWQARRGSDVALAVVAVLLVAVNWWYVMLHDAGEAAPWR
jgi:cytochrome bd-type quinol oxidase subunit 2